MAEGQAPKFAMASPRLPPPSMWSSPPPSSTSPGVRSRASASSSSSTASSTPPSAHRDVVCLAVGGVFPSKLCVPEPHVDPAQPAVSPVLPLFLLSPAVGRAVSPVSVVAAHAAGSRPPGSRAARALPCTSARQWLLSSRPASPRSSSRASPRRPFARCAAVFSGKIGSPSLGTSARSVQKWVPRCSPCARPVSVESPE